MSEKKTLKKLKYDVSDDKRRITIRSLTKEELDITARSTQNGDIIVVFAQRD